MVFDTSWFVIARDEKAVAIHCERGNEEKGHAMSNPNASIACSGLPRRSLSFSPRNDTGVEEVTWWLIGMGYFPPLSSRGLKSPWRSTVIGETKRKVMQ